MKISYSLSLLLLLSLLSGCEVVGGIFKAGVWVGIFAVAIVLGVIFWLVSRSKK